MKKILFYLAALLLAVSTIWLSLITGVEVSSFTPAVFSYHFEKSDVMATTKMSHKDLMKAANKLIDYIENKTDDLTVIATIDGVEREVFNEREKLHMIDVKALYQNSKTAKKIAFFIVLLFLVLAKKRDKYNEILHLAIKGTYALIGLLLIVIAAFALDFERNFIRFHEIFFDNDLWILDPSTDILINMVPEQYFYGLIMMISTIFIVLIVLFVLLYNKIAKKEKEGL